MPNLAARVGGLGVSPIGKRLYATTFALTENPIRETGTWLNGLTDATNWSDCQTGSNPAGGRLAWGDQSDGGFDDSTAILTGTWAPDQYGQATIRTVSQSNAYFEEVEIRLRCTVTATSIIGYEINFRCTKDGSQYVQVVHWNGTVNDFTYCSPGGSGGSIASPPGLSDGNTIKATIIGNLVTAYVNGVQVGSPVDVTKDSTGATITPSATGNPGMGFYRTGSAAATNFGFVTYQAGEL